MPDIPRTDPNSKPQVVQVYATQRKARILVLVTKRNQLMHCSDLDVQPLSFQSIMGQRRARLLRRQDSVFQVALVSTYPTRPMTAMASVGEWSNFTFCFFRWLQGLRPAKSTMGNGA